MRLAPPPNQPPTPNPTPTVWHRKLPSAQVVRQGAYLHARRICARSGRWPPKSTLGHTLIRWIRVCR